MRLPGGLVDGAEAVARVHGTGVNPLIVDSLMSEINRVRVDTDFMSRARQLLERDQEIIDRLAEYVDTSPVTMRLRDRSTAVIDDSALSRRSAPTFHKYRCSGPTGTVTLTERDTSSVRRRDDDGTSQ